MSFTMNLEFLWFLLARVCNIEFIVTVICNLILCRIPESTLSDSCSQLVHKFSLQRILKFIIRLHKGNYLFLVHPFRNSVARPPGLIFFQN